MKLTKMNPKKFFSIVGVIISLLFLIIYFFSNIGEIKSIQTSSLYYLLISIILFILYMYNNGLILKYVVEPFGVFLGKFESFAVSVITLMLNMVTPFRGGALLSAW